MGEAVRGTKLPTVLTYNTTIDKLTAFARDAHKGARHLNGSRAAPCLHPFPLEPLLQASDSKVSTIKLTELNTKQRLCEEIMIDIEQHKTTFAFCSFVSTFNFHTKHERIPFDARSSNLRASVRDCTQVGSK